MMCTVFTHSFRISNPGGVHPEETNWTSNYIPASGKK